MADIHTVCGVIDDMHNASDTEDISHQPVCVSLSGQETNHSAGSPLGEVAGYTELNMAITDNP